MGPRTARFRPIRGPDVAFSRGLSSACCIRGRVGPRGGVCRPSSSSASRPPNEPTPDAFASGVGGTGLSLDRVPFRVFLHGPWLGGVGVGRNRCFFPPSAFLQVQGVFNAGTHFRVCPQLGLRLVCLCRSTCSTFLLRLTVRWGAALALQALPALRRRVCSVPVWFSPGRSCCQDTMRIRRAFLTFLSSSKTRPLPRLRVLTTAEVRAALPPAPDCCQSAAPASAPLMGFSRELPLHRPTSRCPLPVALAHSLRPGDASPSVFRSCRLSRLQRLAPPTGLQVCCALLPIMGFARLLTFLAALLPLHHLER